MAKGKEGCVRVLCSFLQALDAVMGALVIACSGCSPARCGGEGGGDTAAGPLNVVPPLQYGHQDLH